MRHNRVTGPRDRKIVRVMRYPKPTEIEVYVSATRRNQVSNTACIKEELRLAIVMVQLLLPRSRRIRFQSPRAVQAVACFDGAVPWEQPFWPSVAPWEQPFWPLVAPYY